jgi:glucose-6-phosphate-specific signal transduction histidine kinase
MIRKTGRLDSFERSIRLLLAIAALLLAWGYDWTGVDGIGFVVVGAIAFATALAGRCPADAALAQTRR